HDLARPRRIAHRRKTDGSEAGQDLHPGLGTRPARPVWLAAGRRRLRADGRRADRGIVQIRAVEHVGELRTDVQCVPLADPELPAERKVLHRPALPAEITVVGLPAELARPWIG